LTRHVLVIGGGVAGLSTAWELARAGVRVTLSERRQTGQESSWAGAGILSALLPWDYGRAVNRLINASLSRYPGWIGELQRSAVTDPEYRTTGMLVLPPFDAAAADIWLNDHALGLRSVPTEFSGILPDAASGLWLDHVAQVRNPRLLRTLREACEGLGVRILESSEATGLKTAGELVTSVLAGDRVFSADQYVLATGAWSTQFLGPLSRGMPVRPMRGQILLYQAAPGTLPCIVYRNGCYLVPRADGIILAGSTIEDVGFDKATTANAYQDIRGFAENNLPALSRLEPIKHWSGLRPGSPANIPIIARHPGLTNLYINTGHFRYGVTMAPASAALLADILLGRTSDIDPSLYRWPD
jgi:glycine oxidase